MDHKFRIKEVRDGGYAAISTRSPYFYFEAKTDKEARAIAERALDFYFGRNIEMNNQWSRNEIAALILALVFCIGGLIGAGFGIFALCNYWKY